MNLRRLLDSVVTRLLLLALCIVIGGTIVRYFTLADFLREDLSEVVKSQQLALATYVANDINDKIVQRQALLERLSAELPPGLLSRPERLRAWLRGQYESQPLFSTGLFVVDARGTALVDYPALPGRAGTDYADRDYIREGLAGRPFIGRPVIGRAAQQPVLPMATPIRNAAGQVRAVLVGITALAAPGFLDSLMRSRIGKASGGFLLVSPREKLFIAASQADMVLTPTPPPGVNRLHDRAMAGFRGTGITINAKGVEEVSAMVSVPSTDWFVVARLPSAEAFATVGRMQHFLIKHATVGILIFALLASGGLYLVFRPLFYAADHAERMSRGELPLKPLPIVRHDEVGHLISAFNRLLLKLNDNQAELARLAHHDALTGLPNRMLLADRLRQALAQAQRKDTRLGLFFMDLNGFKHINDTLGHDAGDEALRQVARRFAGVVRQADTLARIGGDEFVLLLSELGDDAEAEIRAVAAKCIEVLKAPFLIAGTTCTLGASIGIVLGHGLSSADALLLAADQAMYQAKKTGRCGYVIHTAAPLAT